MVTALRGAVAGCLIVAAVARAEPTTAPAAAAARDAVLEEILGGASTAPATPRAAAPATGPSPLVNRGGTADEARAATVTLSDGTTLTGRLATTPGKPVRVWVAAKDPPPGAVGGVDGQYVDVPFESIRRAEGEVVWERLEREWRFAASGSDAKEHADRTYPARETRYAFTLADGRVVSGTVVAPLTLTANDGASRLLVLHKRDKGKVGETLAQLVWVKRVEFGE